MGLFDDVGPVQEEVSIETMPLVDLYTKAIKDIEELEKSCSMSAFEEMEKTLKVVVQRMGEVPPKAKGMLAGLPSVISATLPSLKQVIGYGPSAAAGVAAMTNSLKTVLNFGLGNL